MSQQTNNTQQATGNSKQATEMLKAIGVILNETPKKAYDADYSHLKPSYKRGRKAEEPEDNFTDYDISSDAQYVDDLHEYYA